MDAVNLRLKVAQCRHVSLSKSVGGMREICGLMVLLPVVSHAALISVPRSHPLVCPRRPETSLGRHGPMKNIEHHTTLPRSAVFAGEDHATYKTIPPGLILGIYSELFIGP